MSFLNWLLANISDSCLAYPVPISFNTPFSFFQTEKKKSNPVWRIVRLGTRGGNGSGAERTRISAFFCGSGSSFSRRSGYGSDPDLNLYLPRKWFGDKIGTTFCGNLRYSPEVWQKKCSNFERSPFFRFFIFALVFTWNRKKCTIKVLLCCLMVRQLSKHS